MTQQGCVYKKKADGAVNTKYVDLLDEDKPISGQKFACLSFVSPDKILEQKNHFFFENINIGFFQTPDFHIPCPCGQSEVKSTFQFRVSN